MSKVDDLKALFLKNKKEEKELDEKYSNAIGPWFKQLRPGFNVSRDIREYNERNATGKRSPGVYISWNIPSCIESREDAVLLVDFLTDFYELNSTPAPETPNDS